MAALQLSNTNTLVPLQCKSSASIFQDKKAQTLSSLLHKDYYTELALTQLSSDQKKHQPKSQHHKHYLSSMFSISLHLRLGLVFIKMEKILTIFTKNIDKSFCKV